MKGVGPPAFNASYIFGTIEVNKHKCLYIKTYFTQHTYLDMWHWIINFLKNKMYNKASFLFNYSQHKILKRFDFQLLLKSLKSI